MDPISQGTFGGVFSQFFSSKKKLTVATVIGIISGLAPDLDVFIKSSFSKLWFKFSWPNGISFKTWKSLFSALDKSNKKKDDKK